MLHFSGGIENPFIIYYIFHMIIASIALSSKESYLQASLALVLIGILTFSECFGVIPHFSLEGFITHNLYMDLTYLTGTGFVFITTSYLVVYMTNNIVAQSQKYKKNYKRPIFNFKKKTE